LAAEARLLNRRPAARRLTHAGAPAGAAFKWSGTSGETS
jgi:hypothetical protein